MSNDHLATVLAALAGLQLALVWFYGDLLVATFAAAAMLATFAVGLLVGGD